MQNQYIYHFPHKFSAELARWKLRRHNQDPDRSMILQEHSFIAFTLLWREQESFQM